ncbi:hypothetical protein HK104_011151, partial [Borealophlyctis nickersoniae]
MSHHSDTIARGSSETSKAGKKTLLPPNGLAITERVFYNSTPGRPQVVMGFMCRLRPPKNCRNITIERIVDILKLAAASHHRLVSYVDPHTLTTHLLGETAADFRPVYRVVRREDPNTWETVLKEEMNTNFDLRDLSKPLWRSAITVPDDV